MKIKTGLFLHKIGDECIVMQDGSSHIDFSNILNLNPTAEYLWEALGHKEFDTSKVTLLLTDRYEVSEEQARRDAEEFIKRIQEAGVTY